MRVKRAVLLAFLLVLYIGPSLFALSYASSATPTEQNMTKDFAPATQYTTEQVAYAGQDAWQNSKVKDGTTWDVGGTERHTVYFQFPESEGQIEGFQYMCFAEIFDHAVTLEVFNGTTNTTLFAFGYGAPQWYNGSSYGYIYNSTTIVLNYKSVGIGAGAFMDYLAIKFIYSTWEEIGDAELVFIVPLDETGLNMLLVLLGLIMIPTSTIYAAKGGLKDASTNKLFYVLIIFFLGWGLLLGGIYA